MARGISSVGIREAPRTHSSTENEHASFLECWVSRSLTPWAPRAGRTGDTALAQVPRGQDIPGGQDRKPCGAELRAVSSQEPGELRACSQGVDALPRPPSSSWFWEGRERQAACLGRSGRRAAGLHTHTVTLGPRRPALGSQGTDTADPQRLQDPSPK